MGRGGRKDGGAGSTNFCDASGLGRLDLELYSLERGERFKNFFGHTILEWVVQFCQETNVFLGFILKILLGLFIFLLKAQKAKGSITLHLQNQCLRKYLEKPLLKH